VGWLLFSRGRKLHLKGSPMKNVARSGWLLTLLILGGAMVLITALNM
jgi:hypothetical protein